MIESELIGVSLRTEYLRGWAEKIEVIIKPFWGSARKISNLIDA